MLGAATEELDELEVLEKLETLKLETLEELEKLGALISPTIALLTAVDRTSRTVWLSRKRTSRFAGCTLTSTPEGGRSMKSMAAGRQSPAWRGHASRRAVDIDADVAGLPLTKTYCPCRVGWARPGRST